MTHTSNGGPNVPWSLVIVATVLVALYFAFAVLVVLL